MTDTTDGPQTCPHCGAWAEPPMPLPCRCSELVARIAELQHALAEKQQLVITYVEASTHNLDRAKAAERERDEARAEALEGAACIAEDVGKRRPLNDYIRLGHQRCATVIATDIREYAEALRAKAKEARDA